MRRVASLLVLVCLGASVVAQERRLHWDELSVQARLDATGRLHVEERHAMVFTGDWNGGERTFSLRGRQDLRFEGMSKIDLVSGRETPMRRGSLDVVDQWDLTDPDVVRWRARARSDRPFRDTKLVWVLRYSLTHVLQKEGNDYLLDHDFAFPDRTGSIERFALELSFDPEWEPPAGTAKSWTAGPIPPGRSFVLRVPLQYSGAGEPMTAAAGGESAGQGPQDIIRPPTREHVPTLLMALLAGCLLSLGFVLLREKSVGRFDREAAREITREWLEKNLLGERAEVVGAMWDGDIGEAEVSALLARMVAEGRIESRVVDGEMELVLKSRAGMNDYEYQLVTGLFFAGERTTPQMIRSHYRERGYNPAGDIREGLQRKVEERLASGKPIKPVGVHLTLLFLTAVAVAFYSATDESVPLIEMLASIFGAVVATGFSSIGPDLWQKRKSLGLTHALLAMLPAAMFVSGGVFLIWTWSGQGRAVEALIAIALLALWLFATAAHGLRSRRSREAIAWLQRLGAAREYLRRELKKEKPAIDDAWYPYVVAFGLDRDVRRWVRSFPATSSETRYDDDRWRYSSSSSSSSSPASPAGWTGGGGLFGGAGATGTWAAAASGFAAGVSAPSSSSSSGSSSSSSGGSSGGGGGGGW